MTLSLSMLSSCQQKATVDETQTEPKGWIIDRFDDIKVLRYEVPGFEDLPLQQKMLIFLMLILVVL